MSSLFTNNPNTPNTIFSNTHKIRNIFKQVTNIVTKQIEKNN
jgi:hypothetical protein